MENREIKFRIFCKKYKEYCEEPDFRWTLSRQGKLYNSEEDEWYDIGERFIVEFFTGLKDSKRTKEYSNGQDIYEGDIDKKGRVCEYFKILSAFGFKNPKHSAITFVGQWIYDGEIIGNIHENPNLL